MEKELEEKIKKINAIKHSIRENEEFLDLLSENNTYYDDGDGGNKEKTNIIYRINCSGYIWTGSDKSNYDREVNDKELITKIIDRSKDVIKEHIKEQLKELEDMFA